MTSGIELCDVTMRFGQTTALSGVSLTLESGKIYGLLGRNGAGKSTLLGCINNRLWPQQGSVTIDGCGVRENDRILTRVYAMGEKSYYPEGTTVRQLFSWTKDFYPGFDMEYAYMLAGQFELDVKKKLKSLSTGYLTIAKLICALSTAAPYLLLDEPVLGLDANHRDLFYRTLLKNYADNPRTIVISTHLIEEVAHLLEHVVILKRGRVLLSRPADELRSMAVEVSGKAECVDEWSRGREVLSEETLGGQKTVCVVAENLDLAQGLSASPVDLQKLFIRLTNA